MGSEISHRNGDSNTGTFLCKDRVKVKLSERESKTKTTKFTPENLPMDSVSHPKITIAKSKITSHPHG